MIIWLIILIIKWKINYFNICLFINLFRSILLQSLFLPINYILYLIETHNENNTNNNNCVHNFNITPMESNATKDADVWKYSKKITIEIGKKKEEQKRQQRLVEVRFLTAMKHYKKKKIEMKQRKQ